MEEIAKAKFKCVGVEHVPHGKKVQLVQDMSEDKKGEPAIINLEVASKVPVSILLEEGQEYYLEITKIQ